MRILVTGATGFVGRPAVDALRARGHHVDAPGLGRARVDLRDHDAVDRALETLRADTLLHTAWYRGNDPINSSHNREWIDHTGHLVQAFLRSGGRRVVTAGSCLEYELGPAPLVEDETPVRPHTAYGQAKAAMADDVRDRCAAFGAAALHLRIGFLYGQGEQPPRVVPALLEALVGGDRFATTTGTQRRDYLHVDDLAAALAMLCEADVEGVVNVGSGAAIPVAELITAFAREIGGLDLVDFGALDLRPGDPEIIELSVKRLKAMGWQPELSLLDGVRRTVHAMYPDLSPHDPKKETR